MASKTLQPVPIVCVLCGQTVTDANHPQAVQQLGRHRCPGGDPPTLFTLPTPTDHRKWTR